MKTKDKVSKEKYERDYKKIMRESDDGKAVFLQYPQWSNPGDFIIRFTLFQSTPYSITSTDTSVNL
jgi:exopolysaccharide biosynthesis predicted pyruvyltransferase EpsI